MVRDLSGGTGMGNGKNTTILLADDQELFRFGLKLLLEREGFDVVADCCDGSEAIQKAEATQPDIAILDVFMPHLSGLDAAKAIHGISPRTRSILLSQYDEQVYSFEHLSNGIAGGIQKSQATESLMQAIREVARGAVYWHGSAQTSGAEQRKVGLSPRERQVLQLLAEGIPMKEIATFLGLSVKTIEGHRSSIMTKLKIRDIAGLVRYAIRQGIIRA